MIILIMGEVDVGNSLQLVPGGVTGSGKKSLFCHNSLK